MKRFVIDNQLSAALVAWCAGKGCVVEHILSLNMAQAPDDWIWRHAAIMTKHEDFAGMTFLRPEPVAVVWLRMGNCRTPALVQALELACPDVIRQLDGGAHLFEVF